MTTPSTLVTPLAAGKYNADRAIQDKRTYTVAAALAADTIIGVIPFKKGMHLAPNGLAIAWADLDDAGSATLDVGFAYTDNTTYADDPNAFFDGLDATAAGTEDEMLTAGVSFVCLETGAPEDGFITIALRDAAASKAGNVTVAAAFDYGNPQSA